jgi:ribosomal protein S18 acetylase RimI-like enzyme
VPSPHGDDAVVALRRHEHREAAEVLVDSHGDYPAFRYVFPTDRRRRALRPFLEATVRDAAANGVVDAVSHQGRIAGIAVWLPPGAYPWSPRRQVRAAPALLRTALAAPMSFRAFAALGANATAAHPRDRHWYLVALGVRHESHGRGLGSRLLDSGLRRADADGIDAYVETSDPANLPFYVRHGFVVVEPDLQLLPGGPPYAALRRPASSA